MKDCSWLLPLMIVGYAVTPFIMFFIERKAHHGEGLAAIRCPVFWATTGASVMAFLTAVVLYPSSQAVVSVFLFGMGLPIAIVAQELSAANRPPTPKSRF